MFSLRITTGCFLFLLGLGCGLVFTATSVQAAQPSEQTEEKRALGFVVALSGGDPDTLLSYSERNFSSRAWQSRSPADWRALAQQLVQRHAGIQIQGVDITQSHNVVVHAAGADGLQLQFIFDFEPEPPHRIAGLGLEAGGGQLRGPDLPPFELSENATAQAVEMELTEYLSDLAARDLFAGAVLVAWRGEPVYQEAFGLASRTFGVPNQVDTRFDLGSISKSFTKVAVGQLLERGDLKLDDTILRHLPDYPNPEVAAQVTIRHLVEHTSGLGDIFTAAYRDTPKDRLRSSRDFFPLFAEKPLQFEPGARFAYSNAGYLVLGAIVEQVSGMPFDTYVGQYIFIPAGMQGAGFFARDEPVSNVAVGYTRQTAGETPGGWRSNLFLLPVKGNPAGSAQASVLDLLRFDTALREHVLLSPAVTNWFFGGLEPAAAFEDDETAAVETSTPADRVGVGMGIAGGAPGVSAVLESDGDLAVIVLANLDEPIAEAIARSVFKPLGRALQRVNQG